MGRFDDMMEAIERTLQSGDDLGYDLVRHMWELGYRSEVIELVRQGRMADGERRAIAAILEGTIKAPKGKPRMALERATALREHAKVAEAYWYDGRSREAAIGDAIDDLDLESQGISSDQLSRALERLRAEPPDIRALLDSIASRR